MSPTLHAWGASRIRGIAVAIAVFITAGCERAIAPEESAELSRGSSGASLSASGSRPATGPSRFIVLLEPKARAADVAREHGIQADFVYRTVMNGFAGTIADAARAGLLRDNRVVRIEPDQRFSVDGGGEQSSAPWNLDRIDQRGLPLDGSYRYRAAGRGVTAYILDTGIRFSHSEFGGRAVAGYDAFGGNGADCRGHGTHVAGTVGGVTYGVAKEARLVSVRVLDCDGTGTTATLLAGLDWVAANRSGPSVVNLSLSGPADATVDAAIERTVAAGIPVVSAAGNAAKDACAFSPARAPSSMTVGATNMNDAKPVWSNFGSCVDWYAPGDQIRSASMLGDGASTVMGGTSMAAPHVTGAAAIWLELHPGATASEVAAGLAGSVLEDAVSWYGARGDLLHLPGDGAVEPLPIEPLPVEPAPIEPTPTEPAPAEPIPAEPAPRDIQFSAAARKQKGKVAIDLAWSGATSPTVAILVNGAAVGSVPNSGGYTWRPSARGSATYQVRICETGIFAAICSATRTVTP